jgi:galactose mutarotase-like enzyme
VKQVIIRRNELTVAIDPLGAELASIKDRQGTEHLWQGDARFWTSRAPVLFPIVGGLKADHCEIDGQTYKLDKHGFARLRIFAIAEQTDASVLMTLAADDETRASYPFEFQLSIRYTVCANSLAVDYQIDNRSNRTLYGSIGAHEGYCCPEGIEAYDLLFEQEETLRTCGLDGNLLNGETTVVLDKGSVLPLQTGYFAVDALVFATIRSQSVTLARRGGGRRIRVDFPGFPSLGIWTRPGAPYLCIEPWCGLPDETRSTGRIDEKRGILAVPALRSLTRSHTITFDI